MSIYIALGANLSNPKQTFKAALKALKQKHVKVIALSGLWQSPAWPKGSGQPDYINACAEVEFEGSASELLNRLHRVEAEFGRVRGIKNAARVLDLDLLDFRGETINNSKIIIPHPRMLDRGFVLLPLSEIAPHWTDNDKNTDIWGHISKLPSSDILPMTYLGALYSSEHDLGPIKT